MNETEIKNEVKIVYGYYPAMVYVACKMPEDIPIAVMAVTPQGEGRIGWVDPEYRDQSHIILGNLVGAVKESIKLGRLKIPDGKLWGYAHKDNLPANNIGRALGIEFKEVNDNGFNKWEVNLV